MNKTVAVIEARMTSSRLPGKVLLEAGGKPMLQILIERLRKAESLDEIVVATTIHSADEPIVSLCSRLKAKCFRGSETNVLERVCGAAVKHGADTLVEVTADCPLVDPWQVDHAVSLFHADFPASLYLSNCEPDGTAPPGMSVQVFKSKDLSEVLASDPDEQDIEHVSYRFYREESGNRYRPKFITYEAPLNRPDIWVTLDYLEDYQLIKALYEDLAQVNEHFGLKDVIEWVDLHPDMHQRCKALRNQE